MILVQHEDCYTNGCIESWDVCHSEMHLTNLIGGRISRSDVKNYPCARDVLTVGLQLVVQ